VPGSLVGMVVALLTAGSTARHANPARAAAPPPLILNVVHHKLKRGAPANYRSLEASIVAAYERAKVPLFFWLTFQSTKEPRDVLYLNLANTTEEFNHLSEVWPTLAAAHPELPRMQQRLAKLIDSQSSTLTARRDEIAFGRSDVDFTTMRALQLMTFHVKPGHEGKFMDAVRAASGGRAPWIVYESTDDSTFVLLAPMRLAAQARRAASVPRAVRELRGVYRKADVQLYLLSPAMSRVPPDPASAIRAQAPRLKHH
jgi:hypothetical protein